jgi:hypothetical protein
MFLANTVVEELDVPMTRSLFVLKYSEVKEVNLNVVISSPTNAVVNIP